MIKTYQNYESSNGISFHHSVSLPIDGRHAHYRAESHQYIEVMILLSGLVDYQIDGAVYKLNPGDCVVVNSRELHSLSIDPETPYERYVLQFSHDLIPKLLDIDLSFPFTNASSYRHIIPKNIVQQTKLVELMKKLCSQCSDKSRYNDALFISTIINCIVELNTAVDALLSSASHLIQTPKTTDHLLQGMIKYVNSNLTKDIRTDELASHLGVSESYLYRFCKRKLSISLHEYINNQKMQLAVALLNRGFTPQYVAIHLGYDYYTTFFTQFKKVVGRSPSEIVNKVPFKKTATPSDIKQAFNQSISKYEEERKNFVKKL